MPTDGHKNENTLQHQVHTRIMSVAHTSTFNPSRSQKVWTAHIADLRVLPNGPLFFLSPRGLPATPASLPPAPLLCSSHTSHHFPDDLREGANIMQHTTHWYKWGWLDTGLMPFPLYPVRESTLQSAFMGIMWISNLKIQFRLFIDVALCLPFRFWFILMWICQKLNAKPGCCLIIDLANNVA